MSGLPRIISVNFAKNCLRDYMRNGRPPPASTGPGDDSQFDSQAQGFQHIVADASGQWIWKSPPRRTAVDVCGPVSSDF